MEVKAGCPLQETLPLTPYLVCLVVCLAQKSGSIILVDETQSATIVMDQPMSYAYYA